VKTWPPTPRSVAKARWLLLGHLEVWGLDSLAGDAVLVLTELVTNAVKHAHPPYGNVIATRFERLEHGVRIEVHDIAEQRPQLRSVSDDAESGRGLLLVDALCEGQWGVQDREGPGKIVWAVLSRTGGPQGTRNCAAV
jgi:two-component sensor histidine kinase